MGWCATTMLQLLAIASPSTASVLSKAKQDTCYFHIPAAND